MNNQFELLDCQILHNNLYQMKDLLNYAFEVYVKIEDSNLRIFGNEDVLSRSKNLVAYFKNADSEYLLAINSFSRDALKINDFILLFESKCKILLSMDDCTLHLYGESENVKLLYLYFMKYDRLIGKQDTTFIFGEDDEIRLEVLCSQFHIKLTENLSPKSKFFMLSVLFNCDGLFTQIGLNNLNCEWDNFILSNNEFGNKATAHGDISSIPGFSDLVNISNTNKSVENIKLTHDNISEYRTIIIDGNNLAFGHGGDKFSYMGIKLAIDYFVDRGHTKIYALLPRHRQPLGGPIFEQLERDDRLKYTPSRRLNNVRETPYDDRFILDAALFTEGVVLSNDQYRDLMNVQKYREIICNRLIPYTFIENHLIIPDDPRGFNGPSLGIILSNPSNKVAQNSPKKVPKKAKVPCSSKPSSNIIARTHAPPIAHTDEPVELKGHRLALYSCIRDILPAHNQLIKQIIIGNPYIEDPNTIINLVLMASINDE